jgi:hypothetical protein
MVVPLQFRGLSDTFLIQRLAVGGAFVEKMVALKGLDLVADGTVNPATFLASAKIRVWRNAAMRAGNWRRRASAPGS